MSAYTQFLKVGYEVPAKFGWFLAGWALVQTKWTKPPTGYREISLEEWNATPYKHLTHPDLHPVMEGKVPGLKKIDDNRAELFHKAGTPDINPSTPGHAAAHH